MSEAGGVLAVVPCLNEAAHLEGIVRQLLRGRMADDLLVAVVDGGSGDGTREIAARLAGEDPRVVLLDNPDRLQAAAVNRAAQALGAGRDWLVRVDAHAVYPDDYCADLVETARRTGADAVAVSMVSVGKRCFQKAAAAAQNSRLGTGGARHRRQDGGGWVDHGHHALMRLDAYREVGGYDETFAANEDAELDLRLAAAGRRIWLADLSIGYVPRADPWRLWRQYYRYGRGRARTLARHRLRPRPRQMLPALVAPALLLAVLAPLLPAAALPAALWLTASLVYGVALGARARCACACAAGPAAMVMHLAWSLGLWREVLDRSKREPTPELRRSQQVLPSVRGPR